jgi:hypothetical protein
MSSQETWRFVISLLLTRILHMVNLSDCNIEVWLSQGKTSPFGQLLNELQQELGPDETAHAD